MGGYEFMKVMVATNVAKVRHLLIMALAAVMVFTLVSASTPLTAMAASVSITDTASLPADIQSDEELYVEAMNHFITWFEDLVDYLIDLIVDLDYITTPEEMVEWVYDFDYVREAIGRSVGYLSEFSPSDHALELYQDSHTLITDSVSIVYELMPVLEIAAIAAFHGELEVLETGLEIFITYLLEAELLWSIGVGIFGEQDSVLVGAWAWEENSEWVYTFNADGTGTRSTSETLDEFIWATWATPEYNTLWIDRGAEVEDERLRIEFWIYNIDEDGLAEVLTLEGSHLPEFAFNFIRQ